MIDIGSAIPGGSAVRKDPTALPSDARPRLRRETLRTGDIDALAAGLHGWRQRYVKLDSTGFVGQLDSASIGPLTVFRERISCAVLEEGEAPAGSIGIVVPLAADGEILSLGTPVSPHPSSGEAKARVNRPSGDAMTHEGRRPLCLRTEAALDMVGVSIACDTLAPVFAREVCSPGRGLAPAGEHVRRLETSDRGALLDAVSGLLDAGSGAAPPIEVVDAIVDLVVDLVTRSERVGVAPRAPACRTLVLRAIAFANEHLREPGAESLTVANLCLRLNVPRRTLQHAFGRIIGVGPLQYLRCVRLARARTLLGGQPASVQDAAAAVGFGHFGAFARDYARLFGELPSCTLARTRR